MKSVSKLQQVKKAIEANPNIVVFRGPTDANLWRAIHGSIAIMEFFYVGLKSPIWTAAKLNALSQKLIPGLKPDELGSHFEDYGDYLSFGTLCFQETIGEVETEHRYTINIADVPPLEGFTDGKRVTTEKRSIDRRIIVLLFPNEKIARTALKREKSSPGKRVLYSIPKAKLHLWK